MNEVPFGTDELEQLDVEVEAPADPFPVARWLLSKTSRTSIGSSSTMTAAWMTGGPLCD